MPPIMPPIRQPWQQLTRYLELTPDQQTGLLRLQAEWQRYLIEKQRRVGDVERELAQETNAKAPDPLSLGLRYAELEAICREARDKDNQNMLSARKLLTAPQTAKLQTLESVYALLPVVGEAGQANLLRVPELNRVASPITIGGIVAVANIDAAGVSWLPSNRPGGAVHRCCLLPSPSSESREPGDPRLRRAPEPE